MNHIYRLIWNDRLHTWIAVAEIAPGQGKGRGKGRTKATARRLLLAASLCTAALQAVAGTLPSGGTVSAGSGSISQSGAAMTINQQSQNLAINWQSFDIGPNASVTFAQPSSSAIALNRVLGADVSHIQGQLKANGQVWILNPNGILFGQSAQVSVGGLVASTLGLSDDDFMAGKSTFSGTGGSVINQGNIKGRYVALLGESVRNEGIISARLGTVALAAGNKVTLDFDGDNLLKVQVDEGALHAQAENRGLIKADGGTVIMTAKAKDALLGSLVNNSGVIQAHTLQKRGGKLVLAGNGPTAGQAKGKGTGKGKDRTKTQHAKAQVKTGRILLLADMDKGTVTVGGTLDASAAQGKGGFIETSGAHVQIAEGAVITAAAPQGQGGQWLIDPYDLTVTAAAASTISSTLDGGTNVGLQTTASGSSGPGTANASGNGDIFINSAISWSANSILTLDAYRSVEINAPITASGSGAGLALKYGQGALAAGNTATYSVSAPVSLTSTGSFSTKLGSDGQTINYTIITSLGAKGSTTGTDLQGINGNLSGNYVLGADINASATSGWTEDLSSDPLWPDVQVVGFNPIAQQDYPGYPGFTGRFDGLGHVIDGLTINRPTQSKIGLFGNVSGPIANLGLSNVAITGDTSVGALAGHGEGDFSARNIWVSGSVTGGNAVGGLVGDTMDSGSISHVYSSANVIATNSAGQGFAGGLVGSLRYSTLEYSYSTGEVRGLRAGGLVGEALGSAFDQARVENSYFAGSVSGNASGSVNLGALAGQSTLGIFDNLVWNTDTNGSVAVGAETLVTSTNVTGLTIAQMHDAANWTGFNFTTTPGGNGWVLLGDNGILNGNNGTVLPMLASEWSPVIRNAHQLQLMDLNRAAHYSLGNDIDASATNGQDVWLGSSFSPIGAEFIGSLDGQNHSIDGLTIDRVGIDNIGLFGKTQNASLHDLNLTNINIKGRYFVGGLVSLANYSQIRQVFVSGDIRGKESVGGVVGHINDSVLDGNRSAGTILGHTAVGGILGGSQGTSTISNNHSSADITADHNYAGGLAGFVGQGQVNPSMDNNSASGRVQGEQYVGGLVGEAHGTISNSHATGAVIAENDYAGGLVGSTDSAVTDSYASGAVTGREYLGGLVGIQYAGTISQSFATGEVKGQRALGGLVGSINNSSVLYSYATGDVIDTNGWQSDAGGLVGQSTDGRIEQSYSLGKVTHGINTYGGLLGNYTGNTQVNQSFYAITDANGNAINTDTGFNNIGTRKTLAELQQLATFTGAGWDISDMGGDGSVWRIYEGNTAPLLRSFLTPFDVNITPDYDGSGAALANIGSATLTGLPTGDSHLLGTATVTDGDTLTLSSQQADQYRASSNATASGLYSDQLGYDISYSSSRIISTPGSAAGDVQLPGSITWDTGTLVIDTSGTVTTGTSGLNSTAISGDAFQLVNGNWSQNAATLAGFSVNDFQLAGGAFLRATSGDGSDEDHAYAIADVYGLQGMASTSLLGKHFLLVGDVDASGTANWNAGAGFVSVGDAGHAFTGSFDGQGYSIDGLTINRAGISRVGLFGSTLNARVHDVGLRDVSVDGSNWVGALVGWAEGSTISDSFVSGGEVAFGQEGGGLVGVLIHGSRLEDSYADVNVTGRALESMAGGLVGTLTYGSTIDNSYASGNVTGQSRVGGLIGLEYDNASSFSHSYATGKVSGTGNNLGGLVGLRLSGTDGGNNFYADTDASGNSINSGAGFNNIGTRKTLAELQQLATFTDAGWDISDMGGDGRIWRIYEGNTAPLLRGLMQQLTVNATTGGADKTYDGQIASGTLGTYTTSTPADASLLLGTLGYSTTGANAGTYSTGNGTLLLGGLHSTQLGYDISYAGSSSLTINKAPLVLTANSATRTYNGQVQSLSGYSVTGLVNGEDQSVLTGLAESGGSGRYPGRYGHSILGSADNYSLSFIDGALIIIPFAPVESDAFAAAHATVEASPGTRPEEGPTATLAFQAPLARPECQMKLPAELAVGCTTNRDE